MSLVDILDDVRSVITEISSNITGHHVPALEAVVSLSPIYSYKRASLDEIKLFLMLVLDRYKYSSIGIKVHPRDVPRGIINDISNLRINGVTTLPDVPTELLFPRIPATHWVGPPSTSMLYRHFLYPEYEDWFSIVGFGTSEYFVRKQRQLFNDVLGSKLRA
jgi:hypothetical protein